MVTTVKAIYQGDGIFRVLETPPEFEPQQQVVMDIWLPDSEFEWDEPYNPSPEAVRAAMGMFEIKDQALAEWLAFSPEVAEQNQFLYALTENANMASETSQDTEGNSVSNAALDRPSI